MRLALACVAAIAVAVVGVLSLEALGLDGTLTWYLLGIVAILVGTLVDYENFYGDGRTKPGRS